MKHHWLSNFLRPEIVFLLVCAGVLSGCEQGRVDGEMERLCKLDGGVKIYENVVLPEDQFKPDGLPTFYRPGVRGDLGGYVLTVNVTQVIRTSVLLERTSYQLVRSKDNKLMGESIEYLRRGGGMPGPWPDPVRFCPESSRPDEVFMKAVFVASRGGK